MLSFSSVRQSEGNCSLTFLSSSPDATAVDHSIGAAALPQSLNTLADDLKSFTRKTVHLSSQSDAPELFTRPWNARPGTDKTAIDSLNRS